jgi:hypothetical protein
LEGGEVDAAGGGELGGFGGHALTRMSKKTNIEYRTRNVEE